MITAQIIAQSKGPNSPILTTAELYYPRIIHAEFMTHRVLSRNASSSRAIPTGRMVDRVRQEMYVPIFRKNRPGMQPGDYLSPDDQLNAQRIWKDAAESCILAAERLTEMGVHKQWANRPLEWFGHIRVLASATDWNNFFALREDVDEHMRPIAQDEIFELSMILKAAKERFPVREVADGEWHLPYVDVKNVYDWGDEDLVNSLIKTSVARSARVSYDNVDGTTPEISKDIALYEKLVGSYPLHASPAEHQATPDPWIEGHTGPYGEWRVGQYLNTHLHGNFRGWIQHRKLLPNEWVPG